MEHAERPTIRKYVFNITVKHPGERPRQKRRQSKRSTILSAAAWLSRSPGPVHGCGGEEETIVFFLVITLSRGREKFKTYPMFLSRQRGCKIYWTVKPSNDYCRHSVWFGSKIKYIDTIVGNQSEKHNSGFCRRHQHDVRTAFPAVAGERARARV